jgi:hypothetical protein
MWSANQLVVATTLILGISDNSVSTTHSLNLTPPTLAIRRQLGAVRSTRDLASRQTLHRTSLSAVPDDLNQQPDEWLNRASKIREEMRELELVAAISRQGKKLGTSASEPVRTNTVEYIEISNSVWALSYRFANDPEESNEGDKENTSLSRRLFGGKVTVKFRQDGYTDIISQESYGSSLDSCNLIKAWGWDIELSKDNENDANMNDQEYILFSMDVEFPNSENSIGHSTATTNSKKERFYFQARKDTDIRSGIISLVDGTVTVKRDIVQKSARWGFFSPAGILAQFRYVGDFVAKPVRMKETD